MVPVPVIRVVLLEGGKDKAEGEAGGTGVGAEKDEAVVA